MTAPRCGGGATPDALISALIRRRETVACAESLTGGRLVAGLIDVPGASAAVRGGIVAYHADLKASLVGVDPAVLARPGGSVQEEVAVQLARGARERCGATWGLGTTGVAGPDPCDGAPVGTVFVAVSGPGAERALRLAVEGDRARIRAASVAAAHRLLAEQLGLLAEQLGA